MRSNNGIYSTYALKSGFQRMLKPIGNWLITLRVTPNQITIFTCIFCVAFSSLALFLNVDTWYLLFMPMFLLLRMALNALDGMVAVAAQQKTALGSVLNEVCDVISDVVLFLAMLEVVGDLIIMWLILIFLIALIELAALAVFQATSYRPYTGPFGKSDRALYLGLLSCLVVSGWGEGNVLFVYVATGVALAVITVFNRIKPVINSRA